MRAFALIFLGLTLLVVAVPALAGDAPPLRYSVEADGPQPAQSAPVQPQGTPAAAPLRYSVQQAPLAPASAAPSSPAPVPAGPQTQAAATPSQPPPQVPEQVVVQATATGYRLGPGDKVHVTVYGESDLTGDFEISGSGQIAFPLIGEVRAEGLTAPALGDELARKLAAGYLIAPRVAVEISAYRPFYIVGEVNKPGEYAYVNGMTALNAIALGGGYTPHADEGVIFVRHEGQAREAREDVTEATRIRPGDVVRVSESDFWIAMSFLQPLTASMAAARYGVQ
ncbi:MAG: polysaccharide export protein [Pseudomonadota bacterium]|nr:polysaccharide export protein [Pseudomonadota bacterium]